MNLPIVSNSQWHQSGRWRLIVDLSAPHGHSLNDAISSDLAQLRYVSVLDAAATVRRLSPGTLMAKMDLHNSYRVLPVHVDDHLLLAIRWNNATYIDTALSSVCGQNFLGLRGHLGLGHADALSVTATELP